MKPAPRIILLLFSISAILLSCYPAHALPPAPEISSSTHPDENTWYSDNDPTFEWTTPSDPSGIAGYSYVLDSSFSTSPDEVVDTTGNSRSYVDVADGPWWFHVRAQNNVGNWSSPDHYKVMIDTTSPEAPAISSPTHPNENMWYSSDDPAFEWTTPSDLSGIAGYSYVLDASPSTTPDEALDTTGNSESYPDVADGILWFHVRALDNAGNWGSPDHYKVMIDVTPPLAPVISSPTHPDESAWYVDNDPTFEWTTPSDLSGIAGYSYIVDVSSSTTPDEVVDTTGNSRSYVDEADGILWFHVRALDNAGNWGSPDHYKVMIDTAPPDAPAISSPTHPNENVWYSNDDPTFEWTTPSDMSGIAGYSYVFDNSSSTIPDTSIDTTGNSKSYTNRISGEWWFHVRALDNAGNWGSPDHYKVMIDTTSPPTPIISSLTHPDENTWYSNDDPAFSWTTPSDLSGIAGYSYVLDSSPSTTPDETANTTGNSKSYVDVADGILWFHVRALDNAGNWGSPDHYKVMIDTAPPDAPAISSPTHPNENVWYSNNDPEFEWTTPSDSSGIAGYSYILDVSPMTTPDETVNTTGNSKSYVDVADGTWWFHVRAQNNVGNWSSPDHYKVMIDTTSPEAPVISSPTHPNEDTWYSNDDPTFEWTTPPSDSSGIAGYSYVFDNSSSTIPDTSIDTTGNSKSYTDQIDGEWWFHVRAQDNAGNWGLTDHYKVMIAPVRQGDLVLRGSNVTIIEGRFYINGSIIVEENATLHLLGAYVNFAQNEHRRHNITLRNPLQGKPRLLVYDSTITSPYIIDAYITDSSNVKIQNSTISYDIYASDYSVISISSNCSVRSLYMWGLSTARIYNSTLSRYEVSYDYAQVRFYDSEVNSFFIAPWSTTCTISNLKPGTVKYWNFITNSSINILAGGGTPNVTLINTKINGWEFGFYGNSNATIRDSIIKGVRVSNSALCQLLNTTYAYLQIRDLAEIQIIWYLDIHVTDSIGQDVPSANVTATYMNTTIAEQKMTDTNGKTRLTLMEKMINVTGEHLIANYTVEAAYETHSTNSSLKITENEQIILRLEDFVIPEFPSILILPLLIIATLLAIIVARAMVKWRKADVSSSMQKSPWQRKETI